MMDVATERCEFDLDGGTQWLPYRLRGSFFFFVRRVGLSWTCAAGITNARIRLVWVAIFVSCELPSVVASTMRCPLISLAIFEVC